MLLCKLKKKKKEGEIHSKSLCSPAGNTTWLLCRGKETQLSPKVHNIYPQNTAAAVCSQQASNQSSSQWDLLFHGLIIMCSNGAGYDGDMTQPVFVFFLSGLDSWSWRTSTAHWNWSSENTWRLKVRTGVSTPVSFGV